ncbi:hypothetical protein AEAC466_19225 [Asticcacaulis sp. AC466]|uniref:LexA family protein n=1 Tax=Asticcacaulis sp. AC466 TaxID=1282362 RepID=UPI0003C3F7E3|nr:hypothetical protein [Asticcacaulis sp. AC466]ESQ82052.1 hypothetical protein AEAC466_19225 [Asticcacaulis sp. AC466]
MTPRERDCLSAIRQLSRDGLSPSYAAIGAAIGIVSRSGVARLVEGLERQGRVVRDPRRAHGITVIDPVRVEIGRLVAAYGPHAVREAVREAAGEVA